MTDWTQEKFERLAELVKSGRSASQIAAEMGGGVTRRAVMGKCFRSGLKLMGKPGYAAKPKPEKPEKIVRIPVARIRPRPVIVPDRRPEADVVIPISTRVTLMELTDKTCRWPIGNPGEPEFRFCGALDANLHADPPRPYCFAHSGLACGQGSPSERRAVREARKVSA